jgi:hypothetical protein
MPPTHHMKMDVKHRLSRVRAGIGDNAVARLRQAFVFGNLSTGQQQLAQ